MPYATTQTEIDEVAGIVTITTECADPRYGGTRTVRKMTVKEYNEMRSRIAEERNLRVKASQEKWRAFWQRLGLCKI